MIGTLAISGSPASKFKKRIIAAFESNMPSSMLISIICAPFSTCCNATATASSNLPSMIKRLKMAEPVTLLRSPTFTNKVFSSMVSASKPERRQATFLGSIVLGLTPSTDSAIPLICAGVVPQQPPTIFKNPERAHSDTCGFISSTVKSYSPKALGKPALG